MRVDGASGRRERRERAAREGGAKWWCLVCGRYVIGEGAIDHEGLVLGEAGRWAGDPSSHVRHSLSCQWCGQWRAKCFASKDTRGELTAVCRHQEGAGASGQAGEAGGRTPVATRSSRRCSTRARTSHTALAPQESRPAARATPASEERSSRNPHPISATTGTSACAPACARAMWRARWRGASSLAARARSSVRPTSHTRRVGGRGGGRRGTDHQHHHTTRVRACVRTWVREVAPTCAMYPASLVLVRLA